MPPLFHEWGSNYLNMKSLNVLLTKLGNFYRGGKFSASNIGLAAHQQILAASLIEVLDALILHLAFALTLLIVVAFFISQYAEAYLVACWYLAILICLIPAAIQLYHYKVAQDKSSLNYTRIETWLIFSGGLISFVVGLSSWLFFETMPQLTVVLAILMLTTGPAVTAVSFAGRMRLWLAINIGLMSPILSYVYFRYDAPDIIASNIFAFWLAIYLGYILFTAYKQNAFIKENLYLKFQLEDAVEVRSKYLAIASHDLRQPMHAIGLYTVVLQPYIEQAGRSTYRKLSDSISALRGLFDNLLDISRLDAKTIEPDYQAIMIKSWMEKLLDEYTKEADDKGLSIKLICIDVTVRSDPVLLTRILRNLISNALKFTQQGEILIDCQRKAETLIISVEDHGTGIPENEIDNVFSEYHQLNSNSDNNNQNKGLGLGLAIVRRLSNLMALNLSLTSKLGVGSCFRLELPIVDK